MPHNRSYLAGVIASAAIVNGAWSTYCVHASVTEVRRMLASRRTRTHVRPNPVHLSTIVVVVPMLHESERASQCAEHWGDLLDTHDRLRLCVVTTERERAEAPDGNHTWDALRGEPRFDQLLAAGRVEILHYPRVNRSYGEQLRWALDLLAPAPGVDYFYVTNTDSRLSSDACAEIIDLADEGVDCAQQSSLFFGNVRDASWIAAGEAFYQSRWTFEIEVFRYLAGSETLDWLPKFVRDVWYQHSVGHGLLLSTLYYRALGGLPLPRYGLEDAALGFLIRSQGGRIRPFATLECGDAPVSLSELQRQRSTWIRGPLCTGEHVSNRREAMLAAQGMYSGLKWALGVPAQCVLLVMLPRRWRTVAAFGLLLGLFGPILRLLTSLTALEISNQARLRQVDIARGLTSYPLAAISCWSGGFHGMCRLIADIALSRPTVQQSTKETP